MIADHDKAIYKTNGHYIIKEEINMDNAVKFSVFTKPWRTDSMDKLAEFFGNLGFDGIEFPLRPGFQVEPQNAAKELPQLVKTLESHGLRIYSVASSLEENIFAACAENDIPIIRIMAGIGSDGFHPSVARLREQIEKALPLCEKYGVNIGVQNHIGESISSSAGLLYLMEHYDPRYVGAIWDAAHTALEGEEPEIGLSTIWSHLSMVNLKNAFHVRTNGPEAEEAEWKAHFTTGRHGRASWRKVVNYLRDHDYRGVVCLTAEYHDEANTNRYIAEDIIYAKSLF